LVIMWSKCFTEAFSGRRAGGQSCDKVNSIPT
jgi:hypothetical protein